jgi:hypothetical protein
MYSIDTDNLKYSIYLENINKLANSLVIKMNDIGIKINESLMDLGYTISTDKNTWKYYLNLSGKKHETNEDVYVYVSEVNREEILSIELLNKYSSTKAELLKMGDFYRNLLLKYPKEESYIKGIMFPVDITAAIEAKDYTILNYNENLIEYQELGLIRYLEGYIYRFTKRWYVREYNITDELYLYSYLFVLHSSLPNEINRYRINKVLTNEVHSFHMEMFFKSHLGIDEHIHVLNNKSKHWLYKNLRYLLNNIGKKDTLSKIITNILTENKIGIGTYRIDNNIPNIENTVSNEKIGSVVSPLIVDKSLNLHYTMDSSSTDPVKSLVIKELNNNNINTEVDDTSIEFYSEMVNNEVTSKYVDKQPTKILNISTIIYYRKHGIDILGFIIDLWCKKAFNNNISNHIEFKDPNTNMDYKLTPKEGWFLLMKFILTMNGSEDINITKYYSNYLLDSNIDKETLSSNLFSKIDIDGAIDHIMTILPNDFVNGDNEAIQNYVNESLNLFDYVFTLNSNLNDFAMNSNFRYISNRLMKNETIDLGVNDTIENLTTGIGLEITDDYNIEFSISELIYSFCGVKIDKESEIFEYIGHYVSIIEKLTSYSTHTMFDNKESSNINLYYNTLTVPHTEKGVIKLLDGESLRVLEPFNGNLVAVGNDFLNKLDVVSKPFGFNYKIEDNTPIVSGGAESLDGDVIIVQDFIPEINVSMR